MLRDRNYHKLADQDNITVITGRARFTGAHSAEITTADGPVAVAADMMFINTGATPHSGHSRHSHHAGRIHQHRSDGRR